jgi:hypothetical protein
MRVFSPEYYSQRYPHVHIAFAVIAHRRDRAAKSGLHSRNFDLYESAIMT